MRTRVAILLALALVAIAVPLLTYSGVLFARLEVVDRDGGFARSQGDLTSIRFGIRNDGWTPVTITGAGRSASFMKLTKVDGLKPPMTLLPGQEIKVEFVYQVTDCDNLPSTPWLIPVRVDSSWGVRTLELDPSPQDPAAWNDSVPDDLDEDLDGDGHFDGDGSVWRMWQVARASFICDWN
jgi:hypothetical protein